MAERIQKAKNQDFSRLTFFIAVIIIKRTEKAVRETVGLQERLREPEMVETGASNAELKITPELSG